jgi:hypothetical protein
MKSVAIAAIVPVYVPVPAPVIPPRGSRPGIFMGWGPKVYS